MKFNRKFAVAFVIGLVTAIITSSYHSQASVVAAQPLVRPVAIRASRATSSLRVPAPAKPRRATAPTASIAIHYLAPGSHNAFGDVCAAWSASAQAAFDYAVAIWAELLQSPAPIIINACWTSLEADILGFSGALSYHRNFPGSVPDFEYAAALANALAQTDLNDYDGIDWDGDGRDADADMDISLNANVAWYLGIDGQVPAGRYDLPSVVLQEVAHGLGFTSWFYYSGGQGSWGFYTPYTAIYDRFVENGAGQKLIDSNLYPNPSSALGAQLLSNNLYFNGPSAKAANGGNRPRLYAPGTWQAGSSLSHLDEMYNGTANALMTFSLAYQEVVHDPGPITLGILRDLGWNAVTECYVLNVQTLPNRAGTVIVAPPPNCADGKYLPLTNVTLTANPVSGYRFAGWANDSTRAPLTTLVMNDNKSVTAIFDSSAPAVFIPLIMR